MDPKIHVLQEKGVRFTHPESVEIGPEVAIERISGQGVVIHGGCRIYGKSTCVADHTVLGEEAPVTVVDCRVGPDVRLKGGFFKKAVFLKNASMGSGAHIREGTILEEEASGAHTVGLKQTILFPFVTIGSIVNFCDCLMAGGTSRKDHSEVGSSYIHFNYTPYQDKATPSLLGDVPRGVMLNQPPVFLGGQGGLVGPCRLAFGTVIAAGSICRKDELRPNRLLHYGYSRSYNVEFTKELLLKSTRIIRNNIIFIANIIALSHWYRRARSLFLTDLFSKALHEGLLENISLILEERVFRLKDYLLKTASKETRFQEDTLEETVDALHAVEGAIADRDVFLNAFQASISRHDNDHVSGIKGLDDTGRAAGTAWLQDIVDTAFKRLSTAIGIDAGDKGI